MTLEEDAAIGRLSGFYNANALTPENPGGFAGKGGMDTNFVRSLRDVATVGAGVAAAAEEVAIATPQALLAAERAEAAGAYVLPALGAGDAGKVVTALADNTYGLIAPATPTIATAAVAGLVKSGSAVSVAADGTMTPRVTVKVAGVAVGAASTLNLVGAGGTAVNAVISGDIATVTLSLSLATGRYWRLRATQTSFSSAYGSYYWAATEVQMFADGGAVGTRLAVSAVTATTYQAGYAATRVIDDNTATDWGSVLNPPTLQTLTFDFGTSQVVRAIKYYPSGPAGSPYTPQQLALEYSGDGNTWTTLSSINMPSTAGAWIMIGGIQ